MTQTAARSELTRRSVVLTKAVLRAAERLGLNGAQLGRTLGLSSATLTRMRRGEYHLKEGAKEYELAALLVRAYRSLDAIAGGDAKVVRHWMRNENAVLGGAPIDKISAIAGLTDVIAYLDARRAIL